MPTEVVDAPQTETEYVPPQAHETPKPKVNRGDIFRKTLDIEQKKERGETVTETPPVVEKPVVPKPASEVPESEQVVEQEKDKLGAETPKSPLDVVTADKKPEVKEEPEDPLKDFDEKNPDWKRAREVMKTQSREKRELEKTIADLKKTPKSDPEEIARLAKERDDLKQSLAEREELIRSVDVRLSDEYRGLAKKRDDTLGKLATRAKSYGVDPDALVSALSLPEGRFKTDQIKAVMSEVDPDDKARITVLMEALEGHNEALYEFEKDAPKKYEEIVAKREAAAREQQEQTSKMVLSNFGKITEVLPNDIVTLREVPEDVPGGAEWNEAIKSAKETALRVLSPGGSDFNETAAIAYKGAHYDAVMNMFLKEHSELLDARKRLAEFDSGGPDFKGGDKPKIEQKLTPGQKYWKTIGELKGISQDD